MIESSTVFMHTQHTRPRRTPLLAINVRAPPPGHTKHNTFQ